MKNIIRINGESYRLATLKEISLGMAWWSGQCYLIKIN